MCDYSLHLIASRPARVGDKLISTSFPHTITRGFASVDERNTAICLLPGTELAFEKEVRCETGMILSWGLGHKVAKFRQVNQGRSNVHHDALEFPDGKTVLLTQLCKGQRATVLQLPAGIGVTVDDAQRKIQLSRPRSQQVWSPGPTEHSWAASCPLDLHARALAAGVGRKHRAKLSISLPGVRGDVRANGNDL